MTSVRKSTDTPPRGNAAGRVIGWMNNLIATAVIVLLALTLGRYVLETWRDQGDPSYGAAAVDGDSPTRVQPLDEDQWVAVQIGALRADRRRLRGDRAAVSEALLERCRELARAAVSATGPAAPETEPPLSWPTSGLTAARQVAEEPGDWSLYELPGPVPMLVALAAAGPRPDVFAVRRTVLCWGLGLPIAEAAAAEETPRPREHWTLFAFRGSAADVSANLWDQVPLPPGSQIWLSLGSADEGGTAVALLAARTGACQTFFDRELAPRGWHGSGWEPDRETSTQRYRRGSDESLTVTLEALDEATRTVLTITNKGHLRGTS